ncbi:hypothetical protein BS78_10G001900 [Paspalum vaginatum]|nr:hypothetical protein BS78_10G001900 [Paspalum vaginatum]
MLRQQFLNSNAANTDVLNGIAWDEKQMKSAWENYGQSFMSGPADGSVDMRAQTFGRAKGQHDATNIWYQPVTSITSR